MSFKVGSQRNFKLIKNKHEQDREEDYYTDENYVVIKKEKLEETLPILEKMVMSDRDIIPKRKITSMVWNGPIMKIAGYFYLEDIPMQDEDKIKKRLVLQNEKEKEISIPLTDITIDKLNLDDSIEIDDLYLWSGFEGEINFAAITLNNKPLPASTYKVYLEIDISLNEDIKYKKIYPLGNVQQFLKEDFYTAKMEYFSGKQEMKYNLLATYDVGEKTLKLKSTKLKDIDPSKVNLSQSKKDSFLYKLMKSKGFRGLYKLFKLLPLNEKKVLFASDSRNDMSGNFKFVYDEMVSRNLDLNYHFMLKKGIDDKKSYKEIVSLAYNLATAKFIMLDDFYPMVYPLKIRKNAELVQLWHAVGAFKTFGFSRIGRPGGPSPKSKNHRNYTKAIVSSKNIAKHYAEGFGIDNKNVKATGIPRTDIFFDDQYQQGVRDSLYEKYPFLKGKKVITFAPTFRGNGQLSAHYPMEVLNLEKLYHSLKDEYVFLFKIHPFVKNDFSIPYQYSDFFYDFSSYREINDLLFITDVLITDYSSVCFEYALLNKPMLFFSYDVEDYVQKRDFYYDYQSFIPGPLVRSTETLIKRIQEGNFEMHKIKPFVNYFFDDLDGKSSQRVVDQIVLGMETEE
ncbi:CDP-glycerol glycerophosphotransferase family protein [Mesobacillus maritimus]|uniref:CDP-glycerol glycerophosphotransferase family protein n=1 Tax=Mesobacillus maritimus TaxID=1643336 RepID=UPI00203BDBDB|nr:CDP-glycerol glycerophosphotransferase family protein [Mesobacillus maritimus]MCM3668091.1 CDP-glycerol glycerophosphotransferase family protein [Mesobacillus maritimus]